MTPVLKTDGLGKRYRRRWDPAWTVKPVTMDDLVLAYMSQARDARQARRPRLGVLR
ncbi:MAG TPA: hypothetical protein VGA04_11380 [Streptosporangiaceae bacterium]